LCAASSHSRGRSRECLCLSSKGFFTTEAQRGRAATKGVNQTSSSLSYAVVTHPLYVSGAGLRMTERFGKAALDP